MSPRPHPQNERGFRESSEAFKWRMRRRQQIIDAPRHTEVRDGRTWTVLTLRDEFDHELPRQTFQPPLRGRKLA